MSTAIADRMRKQADRLASEADKLRGMADTLDPPVGHKTSGKMKITQAAPKKPTWRDPAGKKPTGKLTSGG